MKTIFLVIMALFSGTLMAQTPDIAPEIKPAVHTQPQIEVEYVYCMIIGTSLPMANQVVFDLGQKTPTFRYNYLENQDGTAINSIR